MSEPRAPSRVWDALHEATTSLTRLGRVPGPCHDIVDADLADAFRLMASLGATHGGALSAHLRVYLDGGASPRWDERVLGDPPRAGESLRGWTHRLFGDRPVGIIVNHAERCGYELTRKCAVFLAPHLERHGMPQDGVDLTLFVGDYGMTPFGVHLDDATTDVLHLHLGPSDKTMWVWDGDPLATASGRRRSAFDLEPIVADAQRAGEVLWLPRGHWHVGRTEGFCAAAALALSHGDAVTVLRSAIAAAPVGEVPAERFGVRVTDDA